MRILYLPIETAKRELDSKISIALRALQLDTFDEVILGLDTEVFLRATRPGVILLKSAASFEAKKIATLKKQGHLVYSLDEEGIVPPLNDPSINSRFSPENLNQLDGILSNGPLEIESFPSWVKTSDKVIMSGNPRFDFYGKEFRAYYQGTVSKIREKLGNKKIILVASRFGDVNIVEGQSLQEILEKNGFLGTEEARQFFKGFEDHTRKIFNAFLPLPNLIAKAFPDYTVVVRPHPSESHTKWKEVCTQSNIRVLSDYDIASWLACSEAMIHNGCTTAVEATAMGVPVITYSPVKSQEYDLHHPNEMGSLATTSEEIISLLNEKLKNGAGDGKEKLRRIMHVEDNTLASQRIAQILGEKVDSISHAQPARTSSFYGFWLFYLKLIVKTFLHQFNIRQNYQRIKYPHLSFGDYQRKLSIIASIFKIPQNWKIKRIGFDIISIKK